MSRRFLICGVLMVAACAPTLCAAQSSPPFPRLGGYLISGPFNYDNATYQAQIARLNVAILNYWPGWTGSNGITMQQAAAAIKAINPNIVLTLYVDINELQNPPNAAWSPILNQLDANHWWLYPSGSAGSIVGSSWGTGYYEINTTTFTSSNSSGQNYLAWRAAWNVQNYLTPNPAIDGIYTDNVFWSPRVNGDWNRDGSTDSSSNATVQSWYRQGYVSYINKQKSLAPGSYQLGNIGDWGNANAVITEYQGVLQGGVMEGIIGASWSYESQGQGWQTMMTAYRKMMAAIAAPQLVIFEQYGSATDYQGFRYGFASCLMDNAYYYYAVGGNTHDIGWFDEFNTTLGPATSNPPNTAWQNGVYRRDFQNGIALVNPKGNGPRTVSLETSYKHISGAQAPSVNNGQTVTTVTLNDRDGVILLRTTAQSVPDAPTLTVQ